MILTDKLQANDEALFYSIPRPSVVQIAVFHDNLDKAATV